MIFGCEKNPKLRIRVSRLGRTLEFENGRYETDDPQEIAALKRNRYVFNLSEIERELTEPAAIGTAVHPPDDEPGEEAEESDQHAEVLEPGPEDDDADRPSAD